MASSVVSPKWTTAIVGLSTIIMTLDSSIVNVALPAIAADFSSPLAVVQWVVNAYTLAFAALLLGVGAISDYWGRKSLFLLGHTVFLLSSLACMLSPSITMLIIARGTQGIGAALVFGTCIPLIADTYANESTTRRNQAIGISMTVSVAAIAFGPLVGGIILQKAADFMGHGSWPWIFGINLPLGFFCIVATIFLVPNLYKTLREEGRTTTGTVDYLTVLYTIVGLFSLNYAILYGPQRGWFSRYTIIPALLGIVVLTIMILRQKKRGDKALLDLSMFKIPSFSSVIILGFVSKLFSFGLFSYLIYWMMGVAQVKPIKVGLIIMLMALTMIVTAGAVGKLAKKIGVNNTIAIGMLITGLSLLIGVSVISTDNGIIMVPILLFMGLGGGFVAPFMMDIPVSVVSPQKSGVATGMANCGMPLGTSTGVAMNGVILASFVNGSYAKNPLFQELPAAVADEVRDKTSTGAASQVGDVVKDALSAGDAAQLGADALHYASWGMAVIFIVSGVASLLTVALAKWGIREEDRWENRFPDVNPADTADATEAAGVDGAALAEGSAS